MRKVIPVHTTKIMAMIIIFMSTCIKASAQSPYAMFGDTSKMLEAMSRPVPSIYRVGIQSPNGATFYADFNLNKGFATLYDADGNVLLQDSINENAKAMFTTIDPHAENYYHLSPYSYCGGNPVNAIDPDGRSTWVTNHAEGQYQIVGGNLDDKDRNIYVGDFNKEGVFIPTGSIGVSTSITSFYNSDAKGGGSWQIGSIIDLNDNSGDRFLSNLISNNPPMIDDYMLNARNNQPYDFKVTNGTNHPINGIDIYRGMPIGVNGEGKKIITSARDIGNIAAGYVAGVNGMPWGAARIAFDVYQGGMEGKSTRNAEYYGWRLGNNNTTSSQKLSNLSRSLGSGVASLWNYFTR